MADPMTYFRLMMIAHVAAGALALVSFWIAIAAKKGGRVHLRAGRCFEWSMYFNAATPRVAATADLLAPTLVHPPAAGVDPDRAAAGTRKLGAFLGYLGLVSLATTRRGVRSVQTRRDPSQLRTPEYLSLAAVTIAAGVAVAVLGLTRASGPDVLLLSMSTLGPAIGIAMFVQAFRREHGPRDWLYHHLGSMIGGGIAAHTAFAVFGAGRILPIQLPGAWRIVPWLLPTAIGVPAIFIWIARYTRRAGGGGNAATTPPPLPGS
jgi:hypothetical protein